MINRLPWYKTVKPNLPRDVPLVVYVEAWMRLLVVRWNWPKVGYGVSEEESPNAH